MRTRFTQPRAVLRALLPAALLTLAALAPPATHASGESGGAEIDKLRQPGESPDDAAARMRREAVEHYGKGFDETDKAAADINEAHALLTSAADDASTKAAKLRAGARKRYESAVDHFKKAVKLDPGYHEAWNMLGYSYRRLGRLGEAFQAYDTCLKLKPDYEPAHEYLGEAWLQAGNLEKARAELAWLTERKSTEGQKLAAAIARYEAGDSTSFGADW